MCCEVSERHKYSGTLQEEEDVAPATKQTHTIKMQRVVFIGLCSITSFGIWCSLLVDNVVV